MRNHPAAVGASLLAAAFALVSCSSAAAPSPVGGPTTPLSSTPTRQGAATLGPANGADVQFVLRIVAHHQEALDMVRLADERAVSPEVRAVAADIARSEGPEMDTMLQWLVGWHAAPLTSDRAASGAPAVAATNGAGGNDDAAGDQPESRLRDAAGADFDRLFLQLMTIHHRGAVELAQAEVADGRSPAAVALAHQIVVDQTDEIALITQLPAAR
ncbi:MAG TPA: DUF305 domain-containing protein [Propionicimonas sp.]